MEWRCRYGVIGTALGLLLISACSLPKFPLDATPQLPRDPQLLGDWRCMNFDSGKDDTEPFTIASDTDNARKYVVSWPEGDHTTLTQAYLSRLSLFPRRLVLNVEVPDDKSWFYVRYALLQPNVLLVKGVTGDFNSVSSSAEVRKTLKRQGDKAFEDWMLCVRRVTH